MCSLHKVPPVPPNQSHHSTNQSISSITIYCSALSANCNISLILPMPLPKTPVWWKMRGFTLKQAHLRPNPHTVPTRSYSTEDFEKRKLETSFKKNVDVLRNNKVVANNFRQLRKQIVSTFQNNDLVDEMFTDYKDGVQQNKQLKINHLSYSGPYETVNTLELVLYALLAACVYEETVPVMFKDMEVTTGLLQGGGKTQDQLVNLLKKYLEEFDSDLLNLQLKGSTSEYIESMEFLRPLFLHFKSSRSLNYSDSDTTGLMKGREVWFSLVEENDGYFIESFEKSFEKFEKSESPYKDRQLVAEIAMTMLTERRNVPTYAIFGYLIDQLGKHRLYTYQRLVYKCIAPYSAMGTAMIDKEYHSHFKPLVEQAPQYLEALVGYQVAHKQKDTLVELLSFFRLDVLSDYHKFLHQQNVGVLVPQSKYTDEFDQIVQTEKTLEKPLVVYLTDEPIFISEKTVCKTIEACIELELYAYIDPLVSKLVIYSLDNSDMIPLSLGTIRGKSEKIKKDLLIGKRLLPQTYSGKVFSAQLLKLLLTACGRTKDQVRLQWVMVHLKWHVERCQRSLINEGVPSDDGTVLDNELLNLAYNTLSELDDTAGLQELQLMINCSH